MHRLIAFIVLTLSISHLALSQEIEKVKTSPYDIVALRFKDTYVKITYAQPQKKGRQIFGGLVPYGKVWSLGANETTEITCTRDITINGILLKAGTYSLFAIPTADKWTIIVNSELGLWGSYNYNSKLDVFRFDVPVQEGEDVRESFTLQFDHRNEVADLLIHWDRIKVSIPLKFLN
jgi:hypothetical protein